MKAFSKLLYWYLPANFVRDFFNSGKLLLSTFDRFKQNEHPEQGDKAEGWTMLHGQYEGGTVLSVNSIGMNAYVLCTTSIYDSNLMKSFEADSAFVINQPQLFAIALSAVIPRCTGILIRRCIYSEDKVLTKQVLPFDEIALRAEPNKPELDLNKMASYIFQSTAPESFFLKPIRFRHQQEVRFVFMVNKSASGTLLVTAPEATRFCEIAR